MPIDTGPNLAERMSRLPNRCVVRVLRHLHAAGLSVPQDSPEVALLTGLQRGAMRVRPVRRDDEADFALGIGRLRPKLSPRLIPRV